MISACRRKFLRGRGNGSTSRRVEDDVSYEIYSLRAGDTLSKIAPERKIKLKVLISSNPGIDP
jgi:hypothetical protein